jgi:hypothetical protein
LLNAWSSVPVRLFQCCWMLVPVFLYACSSVAECCHFTANDCCCFNYQQFLSQPMPICAPEFGANRYVAAEILLRMSPSCRAFCWQKWPWEVLEHRLPPSCRVICRQTDTAESVWQNLSMRPLPAVTTATFSVCYSCGDWTFISAINKMIFGGPPDICGPDNLEDNYLRAKELPWPKKWRLWGDRFN